MLAFIRLVKEHCLQYIYLASSPSFQISCAAVRGAHRALLVGAALAPASRQAVSRRRLHHPGPVAELHFSLLVPSPCACVVEVQTWAYFSHASCCITYGELNFFLDLRTLGEGTRRFADTFLAQAHMCSLTTTCDSQQRLNRKMSSSATFFPEPYPAKTKTVSGPINGVPTDVMSVSFADKIVITVSQGGRLAHWVYPSAMPPKSKF